MVVTHGLFWALGTKQLDGLIVAKLIKLRQRLLARFGCEIVTCHYMYTHKEYTLL
jgi:hypothetical protein